MIIRLGLLTLMALFSGVAAAETPKYEALQIGIDSVTVTGQITVSMHNVSQEPLRLWSANSDGGTAPWRILHISKGVLHTYYDDPLKVYNGSLPAFNEVPVDGSKQIRLDLTNRFWLPEPDVVAWASGDTVIVVYDALLNGEAQDLHIWSGVVSAMTVIP